MSEANATALQPKKKKNPSSGSYKRKKALVAYSFILPNFLGFLILTFVPIVFRSH